MYVTLVKTHSTTLCDILQDCRTKSDKVQLELDNLKAEADGVKNELNDLKTSHKAEADRLTNELNDLKISQQQETDGLNVEIGKLRRAMEDLKKSVSCFMCRLPYDQPFVAVHIPCIKDA